MGFYILLLGVGASLIAGELPEGKGKELVVRSCIGCHKADSFSSYQHSKDEYSAIVVRMAGRGAAVTADEQETIAAYLAKNFPKVEDPNKINVNKATAKEMETALGLTEKEAAAVVSYRERHGSFHAVGDLYQIYGVDGAKIEAQKDKIGF